MKYEDLDECSLSEPKIWSCRENVLYSLLYDKQVCREDNFKSCVVKEYTVKNLLEPILVTTDEKNGFHFRTWFTLPKSSRQNRKIEPYKSVNTEYYLMNEIQLIGTVGGTLGLTIGFSFFGFITSITKEIINLKNT